MPVSEILLGLAFFLIIEGLAYALAPRLIKDMAKVLPSLSDEQLRGFGVVAIAIGVVFVWLIHG